MAKRLLWFGVGAASGCVAAVWGLSSVRRTSQRLTPERVTVELGDALRERSRTLGEELRDAVNEGREAMKAREHELLDSLRSGAGSSTRVGSRARPRSRAGLDASTTATGPGTPVR